MGQIFTVTMPDIGEGVVEGEVIEWLKKVNDPVTQDEPVVVVMTDKATVELPAPYPGKISKHYFLPGQIAIKDKPLYDIELQEGASATEAKQAPEAKAEGMALVYEAKLPQPIFEHKTADTGQVHAIPKVRQIAKELGVDLSHVKGTGKEGRITIEDLHAHHKQRLTQALPPSPILHLPGDQEIPLVGIKNLMAKKMKESKARIPHFSFFEQVDASRLVRLREKVKLEAQQEGLEVTYMPFFIKALSLTLKKHPHVNGSVDDENNQLVIHQVHNIGVAMSTTYGLIVPVLKNVQEMGLKEIIHAYAELKTKAFTGTLKPQDMKDATITITNFGVLGGGGLWATPVINHPEVAILGLARIQPQPIVKEGVVAVRDVLNLSWSFDHRVIDGDLAATFSHDFATFILNPAPLL